MFVIYCSSSVIGGGGCVSVCAAIWRDHVFGVVCVQESKTISIMRVTISAHVTKFTAIYVGCF